LGKHNLVLGWSLLLIVSLINFIPYFSEWNQTQPYTKVKRVHVDWEGLTGLEIIYTFYKVGECELKNFAVVGFNKGVPSYLNYTDLDKSVPFNREEGDQALQISIDLEGKYYDKVEIRTTHLCTFPEKEPELVNRIFTTIYQENF